MNDKNPVIVDAELKLTNATEALSQAKLDLLIAKVNYMRNSSTSVSFTTTVSKELHRLFKYTAIELEVDMKDILEVAVLDWIIKLRAENGLEDRESDYKSID